MTDLLYLRDAYIQEIDAEVTDIRDGEGPVSAIALDQTVFYPTGGGQPNDIGTIAALQVADVHKEGPTVWHVLEATQSSLPPVGAQVHGRIDWGRRHSLMRTHTALHVLCGVIWNEWGRAVTGGNMEPMTARMDFEFDPLPEGFGQRVEELVNAEIEADRQIEVSFIPRGRALMDEGLIRTKADRVPETVSEIRVVDIVGLDKQADGGTHVRSTSEVGRVVVTKTESKGKGNKRIRIRVEDA